MGYAHTKRAADARDRMIQVLKARESWPEVGTDFHRSSNCWPSRTRFRWCMYEEIRRDFVDGGIRGEVHEIDTEGIPKFQGFAHITGDGYVVLWPGSTEEERAFGSRDYLASKVVPG